MWEIKKPPGLPEDSNTFNFLRLEGNSKAKVTH